MRWYHPWWRKHKKTDAELIIDWAREHDMPMTAWQVRFIQDFFDGPPK